MKRLFAAFGLVALLAGCEDGGSAEGGNTRWRPTMVNPPIRKMAVGEAKPVSQMAPDDVIVSVNGVALTKKDFDAQLGQITWRLNRSHGMDGRQKSAIYTNAGLQAIPQFVRKQAFVWAAREKQCANRAAIDRGVDAAVKKALKMFRLSEEEFDRQVPGGLDIVKRQAEDNVWIHSYVSNNVAYPPPVTLEIVSNILKSVAQENAAIARTNAMRRAKLAEYLETARAAGTNFVTYAEKVAARLGDDWEGGEWTDLSPDGIEDAALKKLVQEIKVGEVSDIVEDEECYMILRAADRTTFNDSDPVTLERLAVMKLEPVVLQDADPEVLRRDFTMQDCKAAEDAHFDELLKRMEVVYPHGTNFWKSSSNTDNKSGRNGK